MALKHRLHHTFTIIRRVKTWQLLIVLAIFIAAAAFFLRQNNLEMIRLRDAVKAADEQAADTKAALLNLQRFVSAHMNTDLGGGVVLQETYQRAYEAAVQAAANSTNPNAAIYAQVELECRPVYQRTHSFPAYTQCAHDKLSQLAPGQDPLAVLKTPSADLYRYNFASPIWSADPAGFTVLAAIIVAFVFVLRTITYLVLRAILKAHR